MKQSQKEIVKEQLKIGSISRNWCLERRITRLGAIICDLQKEGYNFKTKYIDKDFLYFIKEIEPVKEPHKLQLSFDKACVKRNKAYLGNV